MSAVRGPIRGKRKTSDSTWVFYFFFAARGLVVASKPVLNYTNSIYYMYVIRNISIAVCHVQIAFEVLPLRTKYFLKKKYINKQTNRHKCIYTAVYGELITANIDALCNIMNPNRAGGTLAPPRRIRSEIHRTRRNTCFLFTQNYYCRIFFNAFTMQIYSVPKLKMRACTTAVSVCIYIYTCIDARKYYSGVKNTIFELKVSPHVYIIRYFIKTIYVNEYETFLCIK